MSGATDAPFRRQALRFGAPAVVSEMTASETLLRARPDAVRRARRHEGGGIWIVQLAGRRPAEMRAAAALLAEAGVDVIDINMGCPSRHVTSGASGSALMREPDLAKAMIDATLDGAAGRPVTLKMRLGWDDGALNAPDLACAAEASGVSMITVHGRTRCQFYKGAADWAAIGRTVERVSIPVIANGDVVDAATARAALNASRAHGVMIGRAAVGRPWLPGQIAAALAGQPKPPPTLATQIDALCDLVEDSAAFYGARLGVRTARKHLSAWADQAPIDLDPGARRAWRTNLCTIDAPNALFGALKAAASSHETSFARAAA